MITLLCVLGYVLGWMLSSAFFTRHWVVQNGCTEDCGRERYRKSCVTGLEWVREEALGDYEWAWRKDHAPTCNQWVHAGREPSEAMGIALAWPITLFYFVLTYVHRYDPPPKPGKGIKLTQKHIEYLDKVLDNTEIKELNLP